MAHLCSPTLRSPGFVVSLNMALKLATVACFPPPPSSPKWGYVFNQFGTFLCLSAAQVWFVVWPLSLVGLTAPAGSAQAPADEASSAATTLLLLEVVAVVVLLVEREAQRRTTAGRRRSVEMSESGSGGQGKSLSRGRTKVRRISVGGAGFVGLWCGDAVAMLPDSHCNATVTPCAVTTVR